MINSYDIANTFNNYFAAMAQSIKKHEIFTYFFQIILGMSLAMQYLYNLLVKKIWLASYPLLTLKRLLAQIIYFIKYYFLLKIKCQGN